MADENENEIDWTKATDEQLAQATAELKNRRPLTDLEGRNWGTMSATEFAESATEVFSAVKQHSKLQRIQRENAEYMAEKAARENRDKQQSRADA